MPGEGAVDRYGSPGAPLVIALHGAVANRKTWLPLARLVANDYELWCPDLPGHGARRDEPFTLRASLATVAELVARARPRRVVVAGDSLGGYLALLAARAFGDVAACVAGGCTWSMHGAWGALARASGAPPDVLERVLGARRSERLVAALVPRFTDAATAAAVVAGGLRTAARGESLRELAGLDLVELVRAIDAPIVFVNGARDWPTRAGEASLLRAARGASLELEPGAGHGVGLLAPAVFARGIARLVQT